MLRIATKPPLPPPPTPEEDPPAPPQVPPPDLPSGPSVPPDAPPDPKDAPQELQLHIKKLPMILAVYKPPQLGPFICANCDYYEDDKTCSLVEGDIEPKGVCNLFSPILPDSPQDTPPVDENEDGPPPVGDEPEGPEVPPAEG